MSFLILKKLYQLIFPALNKRGSVCDAVKYQKSSNHNTTDCCAYKKQCKTICITLKMMFSALVCYCHLDARQESYDLGEFPVLVRQNIERTLIKLKVGKW